MSGKDDKSKWSFPSIFSDGKDSNSSSVDSVWSYVTETTQSAALSVANGAQIAWNYTVHVADGMNLQSQQYFYEGKYNMERRMVMLYTFGSLVAGGFTWRSLKKLPSLSPKIPIFAGLFVSTSIWGYLCWDRMKNLIQLRSELKRLGKWRKEREDSSKK